MFKDELLQPVGLKMFPINTTTWGLGSWSLWKNGISFEENLWGPPQLVGIT